jgi:hypothetical protein
VIEHLRKQRDMANGAATDAAELKLRAEQPSANRSTRPPLPRFLSCRKRNGLAEWRLRGWRKFLPKLHGVDAIITDPPLLQRALAALR